MAQKHRKLFPTNSTDCELYPCDPYPDGPPDPEFFFPLPPPPPPPRPPPLSSSSTTTISPYLTVSLSLFAAISVLITAYFVLARRCFRGPRPESGDHEEFLDRNRGPEIDHPIWYINTVGLQSSVINSIAIFKYKKGNTPIEGSTCSVCLSEFIEDETLRLLPKCNHAFHIVCIDTWLRSHTNCPLCRAHILSNSLRAPSANENTNIINTNFGVTGNLGINSENTGERDSSVVSSMREKGRRSVSMGSSMEVNIVINNRNDEHLYNFDNNRNQNNGNLRIGSSSSAESLDTSPNSIKRSFSCSGILFSSARYNNKSSSSILPL